MAGNDKYQLRNKCRTEKGMQQADWRIYADDSLLEKPKSLFEEPSEDEIDVLVEN